MEQGVGSTPFFGLEFGMDVGEQINFQIMKSKGATSIRTYPDLSVICCTIETLT
ncbi:hypothetical protein CH063_02802 [Colletotrichum higginsianum]|uniref:Uncharacterized protein n=1 Tax=Colletotrichum higginsianum (strain IMI 349063) TaxID=759273 RepID=H1VQ15_COLHI|nr:hypothetical protein CH063_02802 [Colletotrichum higginsianum]